VAGSGLLFGNCIVDASIFVGCMYSKVFGSDSVCVLHVLIFDLGSHRPVVVGVGFLD